MGCPLENLRIGCCGLRTKHLQLTLNAWMMPPYNRFIYPALPKLRDDGLFGPVTQERLCKFQRFRLVPESGEVDFPTLLALNPVTKFKIDLRPTGRSLKLTGENPLWKGVPPLPEKSAPPSSGKEDGPKVELSTAFGRTLWKSGVVEPGDYDFTTKQVFEAEIASYTLRGPLKLGLLGAFTPESGGLEGSVQLSLEDVLKKGPFAVTPNFTFGVESERFRNLVPKLSLGLEVGFDVPRIPGATLSLGTGVGAAVEFPLTGDDRKSTFTVPLDMNLNFQYKF